MSDDAPRLTCSRASCREDAAWVVVWRNPRIHSPDRRKEWLACEEHVGYLRDYLAARAFPVRIEALTRAAGEAGAP